MLRNYNLVFIGDSNDAVVQSSYVRQAMIDNVLDLSGKTSVGELVTSIANMDILITIDSAAMHIGIVNQPHVHDSPEEPNGCILED